MNHKLLNFREVWMLGAAAGLGLEDYPWSDDERSTIQEALDKLPHLERELVQPAQQQTRKEEV